MQRGPLVCLLRWRGVWGLFVRAACGGFALNSGCAGSVAAVFWMMVPLVCCAPICLVVGTVFVVQMTNSNVQSHIDTYNAAVQVRACVLPSLPVRADTYLWLAGGAGALCTQAWTAPPDPSLILAATVGWNFHASTANLDLQFSTEVSYTIVTPVTACGRGSLQPLSTCSLDHCAVGG